MPSNTSPAIDATQTHDDTPEVALARVDRLLGAAEEWSSPLIRFRLSDESQADWKEEVGHWLGTAERLGFADVLVKQRLVRAKQVSTSTEIDPNDGLHRMLVQELAEAEAVHYFTHTGWTFRAWQPELNGFDIDASLQTPSGALAQLQVKGSDSPGRLVNGKRFDGENDAHVIEAIRKGAAQLPRAGAEARFVVACANRTWPISSFAGNVIEALIGASAKPGSFWTADWEHISGVVLLDLVRFGDGPRYHCTALLNPRATVKASPKWFPHARVGRFDGNVFEWVRGAPNGLSFFPDGPPPP